MKYKNIIKQKQSLINLGQMIYMDNWQMMMYLGTPVMPDLNALVTTGLYINDLSMHDFSRLVVNKIIHWKRIILRLPI